MLEKTLTANVPTIAPSVKREGRRSRFEEEDCIGEGMKEEGKKKKEEGKM
jgi:hypothetical protein